MAREYMISKGMAGVQLQITEEGQPEQHHQLRAASDKGLRNEAEGIINDLYHHLSPFPGFHWQEMSDGWRTTDHDLK